MFDRCDDLLCHVVIVIIEYTGEAILKTNQQLGDQNSNDGIYFIAYAKKKETPSTQTQRRI